MKSLIVVLIALAGFSSHAAEVLGARLTNDKRAIELDIRYGGGCEEHKFTLDIGSCLESDPVQCEEVRVVDNGLFDGCEMLISETVVLSLKKAGLIGDYYSGALLTINGDRNSKAQVTLP